MCKSVSVHLGRLRRTDIRPSMFVKVCMSMRPKVGATRATSRFKTGKIESDKMGETTRK